MVPVNNNNNNNFVLNLLWPFGYFISFIFNYNYQKLNGLILFFSFYALSINLVLESDASRYFDFFNYISSLNDQQIISEFTGGDHSDFYLLTIAYISSIFTKSPSFFFTFLAIIYNYLFISSIKIILKKVNFSNIFLHKLLIFILLFYVPFFYINGIRFYTAFFLFFYCSCKIFIDRDYRFYLFYFFTPLIHFSFIIPSLFMVLSFFFKNNRLYFLGLLIFSIFFNDDLFDLNILSNFNLGGALLLKANNYISVDGKERFFESIDYINRGQSVYKQIFTFIKDFHIIISVIIFFIIFYKKKIREMCDSINPYLLNFIILNLSLVNFTSSFPEGYRFQSFFVFSFLMSGLIFYDKISNLLPFFKKWFLFLNAYLLIYCLSLIYVYFDTIDFSFFLSNWIFEIFYQAL